MLKLNFKKSSFLLTVLLISVSMLYFNNVGQAKEPKRFDLGDFVLKVNKVEYFLSPAYNSNMPDVFEISATLLNKAGENISFEPSGELYFKGESGKDYFIPNIVPGKSVPFDLKRDLGGQHERFKEYVKKGVAKDFDMLPAGKYRWSFGTQIDRDDKIVAVVYRNGDSTTTLSLEDIEPVIHERPTVKPVEGQ